jgi:hypothetical protein
VYSLYIGRAAGQVRESGSVCAMHLLYRERKKESERASERERESVCLLGRVLTKN